MKGREGERGTFIVAVVAILAILMILSGLAAQRWADVLRRDKEEEMIFRAREMAKGLYRYRKDRGALPTELKMLAEPGSRGQYFVRQLYADPLVKDGKWGLLYASPQGGILDPNSVNPDGASSVTGQSPMATAKIVSGLDSGMKTPTGATELAGLQIAGVKSLCKEKAFRVYNDQNEYAMWFFSVFDVEKQLGAGPGLTPGGQAGGAAGVPGTGAGLPGSTQAPGPGGLPRTPTNRSPVPGRRK